MNANKITNNFALLLNEIIDTTITKHIDTPHATVKRLLPAARVAHTVETANPTMNQSERRRSYD